jgi:demethylmenaquinone methyltransferase/2-methoxy-6-polyprenyl-1,4-benzoquinol methylase
MVSGHADAYTYLPESVMSFPDGDDFLDVLRAAGLRETEMVRMTFGIASIYIGVKRTNQS